VSFVLYMYLLKYIQWTGTPLGWYQCAGRILGGRGVWGHTPLEFCLTLECPEVHFGVYLEQITMFHRQYISWHFT